MNENNNNNENREIIDKENEQNRNNNFIVKYYKVETYVKTIKFDVVEKEGNIIYFKYKGITNKYNYLSYEDVFQKVFSLYEDYFLKLNFSFEQLEIDTIIKLIVNLIYYLFSPDFNEKNLALFLYKTIIVLKQLEIDLNEYNESKVKI